MRPSAVQELVSAAGIRVSAEGALAGSLDGALTGALARGPVTVPGLDADLGCAGALAAGAGAACPILGRAAAVGRATTRAGVAAVAHAATMLRPPVMRRAAPGAALAVGAWMR